MREVPLPLEWRCLEGKVHYVQFESDHTVTCTCPFCGGDIHQDNEWPDRCTLFFGAKASLFCRRCGKVAYPDNFGDGTYERPSDAEMERRRQERVSYEEARKRSAERALQLLREEHRWQRYYDQAGDIGHSYWRNAGVPEPFQDLWQLGWDPAHEFYSGGVRKVSPTATIPLFDHDWQCVNVKHRIINTQDVKGKYRSELAHRPAALFLCDPDKALQGHVIAVEGEKKSMVTFATLDDASVCMVGLPGATPSAEILAQFADADRVTLIVDPDARKQAWDICKTLGTAKCRVLRPAMKIDDLIVAERMSKRDLRYLLDNALPAIA